jgi:hypothetical protein
MDNFLTLLYFELFKINEREGQLMSNNTWENSEAGKNANIRNDQSISEVREQHKLMIMLIEKYIEKLKRD